MKTLSLIIIFLLLLSACSNGAPKKIHYYLLTPYSDIAEKKPKEMFANINLYLQNINLPQYLKQSQLVLLKGSNQLHFSHYHLWAEGVEQGIEKALKQELTQVKWLNKADNKAIYLTIEIDDFYPTTQSEVILAGRYWLINDKQNKEVTFSFKQPLQGDGFTRAVAQMHTLLVLLSKNIEQTLNNFN